ncbi:urease accessory protein UreE [Campylobacter ureolyticus]|uniref:Urease accessory protein UreE n=1 Tax=Campylobacter ureolyticus TaxID=827 RepID=A0AAE7E8F7_9BACT|nr:urease accessory protein UreE [Campylobacter ureolyticus]MCR8685411.1 urease accessory protein UreE [Campylobacter ureolyticus]QKF83552.1 urease accessory protein UreE [Campylobacter ureolyticus]QQY36287.1 urease accessory protein UreE [Campylobacter ureolyticus]SUX25297.1 Urease accessory protein UreE [Campylobacter ureolyticus]
MIVNKILGNLDNFDLKDKKVDFANISNDDRVKKVLRVKSNNGVEIGINVEDELKDGDILAILEDSIVVIKILPTDVLEISPKNLKEMGIIAHNIGNRHTPAIFEENLMIIEPDSLIEEFLKNQNVDFKKTKRVLKTALRHASHSH